MLTFIFIFDIKVADIRKRKRLITSPTFSTDFNNCGIDWQLSFVTKRTTANIDPSIIKLEMIVGNFGHFQPVVCFKLVEKEENEEEEFKETFFDLRNDINGVPFKEYSLASLAEYDFFGEMPKTIRIFAGNVFKIVCKLSIERANFFYDGGTIINWPFGNEAQYYSDLFTKITDNSDDDFLSDMSLVSSDHKILRCHRLVLCTNSTFFNEEIPREIFRSRKPNEPYAKSVDFDRKTLIEVLRFIYTKVVVTKSIKMIENLLRASRKYDLEELKSICEHLLKLKLNAKNIFQFYDLAIKYGLNSLLKSCKIFYEVYRHILSDEVLTKFRQYLQIRQNIVDLGVF